MRGKSAALVVIALVVTGVLFPAAARARPPRSSGVVQEKDVNLDHARRLASVLRSSGVHVDLTRTDDDFVPLHERTARAGDAGADVFVSVHANGSTDRAVRGTEVYAQMRRRASTALANHVLAGVTTRTGTNRRGVFHRAGRDGDYYAVLRTARVPAVIVEVGYLSNPHEARNLASTAFRARAAEGMAAGITAWLAQRGAARGGAAPPPQRGPVPLVQAPTSITAASSGRDVTLTWPPVPGATGYRVWRDGQLVADVGPVSPGAPFAVEVDDPQVPGGRHRYEVRALLRAGPQVLDESPSAVAQVTLPWLVAVDAGHGGHDPGAVGRF